MAKQRYEELLQQGEYIAEHGITEEMIEQKLKEFFLDDSVYFCIRTTSDCVEKILLSGRFKSQFETQTSQGLLDPKLRRRAEKVGLGVPKDVDPKLRPIYGYVKFANVPDASSLEEYGEVRIQLKKQNLFYRTTFTDYDSLNGMLTGEYFPAPVTNPSLSASKFVRILNKLFTQDFEEWFAYYYESMYIELQFMKIVTINDIEIIEFAKEPPESLQQLMKELGILWRVMS